MRILTAKFYQGIVFNGTTITYIADTRGASTKMNDNMHTIEELPDGGILLKSSKTPNRVTKVGPANIAYIEYEVEQETPAKKTK